MSNFNSSPRSFSLLDYFAILVFVVCLAAAGFLYWQNKLANDEKNVLLEEQKKIDKQLSVLKTQKFEKVAAIQKFLNELKNDEIIWSKVIESIHSITPQDVNYSAYAGTEARQVNFNVETNTIEKVMETINAFTNNKNFEDVFVPSVNKGLTPDGRRIFSFSLSSTYKK